MPVLAISKFDEDPIKNEWTGSETKFPIISLYEIF